MTTTSAPPRSSLAEGTIEAILPVLRFAKSTVTGIGVPGVEPTINGVLHLAEMLSVDVHDKWTVQTMKSNKESLAQVQQSVALLFAIDASETDGALQERLIKLQSYVIMDDRWPRFKTNYLQKFEGNRHRMQETCRQGEEPTQKILEE
ncbi:hypothetical protein GGX14DRAFT_408743 [Mycena pura]|uniref:Uncharacterized protein n=1 Tax=Mycena pura TaxID=153505 RepID=A0AAD6UPK1_9AGAR|nr:hypothetical protein GGX14DRAFT_408743 [Mycena pura]